MADISIKPGQKYRHKGTGRTLEVTSVSDAYATLNDWQPYTHAALRTYWTLIRDAPEFPYWAWDMIGQQMVKVIGQTYACARLSDGMRVYCSEITRNIPEHALDEMHAADMADDADARDTAGCAFGPEVQ